MIVKYGKREGKKADHCIMSCYTPDTGGGGVPPLRTLPSVGMSYLTAHFNSLLWRRGLGDLLGKSLMGRSAHITGVGRGFGDQYVPVNIRVGCRPAVNGTCIIIACNVEFLRYVACITGRYIPGLHIQTSTTLVQTLSCVINPADVSKQATSKTRC